MGGQYRIPRALVTVGTTSLCGSSKATGLVYFDLFGAVEGGLPHAPAGGTDTALPIAAVGRAACAAREAPGGRAQPALNADVDSNGPAAVASVHRTHPSCDVAEHSPAGYRGAPTRSPDRLPRVRRWPAPRAGHPAADSGARPKQAVSVRTPARRCVCPPTSRLDTRPVDAASASRTETLRPARLPRTRQHTTEEVTPDNWSPVPDRSRTATGAGQEPREQEHVRRRRLPARPPGRGPPSHRPTTNLGRGLSATLSLRLSIKVDPGTPARPATANPHRAPPLSSLSINALVRPPNPPVTTTGAPRQPLHKPSNS